jgi:hypothetical protein
MLEPLMVLVFFMLWEPLASTGLEKYRPFFKFIIFAEELESDQPESYIHEP